MPVSIILWYSATEKRRSQNRVVHDTIGRVSRWLSLIAHGDYFRFDHLNFSKDSDP